MSDRLFSTKLIAALGVLSLGLWVSPAAQADPVTFHFAGVFTAQTGFLDPVYDFTGATISGFYTFDSGAANVSSDTSIGNYPNAVVTLFATITFNGGLSSFALQATATGGAGDILIWDNHPNEVGAERDRYLVESRSTTHGLTDTLVGYTINSFTLEMGPVQGSPPPPNFITSTDLPLTPPELFGNPRIFEAFFDQNKLEFELTGLTRVPEPGTLLLLGLGLAGLGLRVRGRRP